MDNTEHPTSADDLIVAELRRSNDIKWERLKELYSSASRLAESVSDGAPHSGDHGAVLLLDDLQAELELLPRTRWAKESQEMMQMIDRSLTTRTALLDGGSSVEDAAGVYAKDLWTSEIVSTYNRTKQLNKVLRQDIKRERETLQRLHRFRDETKEIHAELIAEKHRLQQEALARSKKDRTQVLEDESTDSSSINQLLRRDLSLVCARVEAHLREDDAEEGADDLTWSLEQLLGQLVSRLLRNGSVMTAIADEDDRESSVGGDQALTGDDSSSDMSSSTSSCGSDSTDSKYLSIDDHPVRREHVELLLNSCIVETHRDDENLIRLVDYRWVTRTFIARTTKQPRGLAIDAMMSNHPTSFGYGSLVVCRTGKANNILLVALSRAQVRNAINDEVYEDLIGVMRMASHDDSLSAVVLTGSGDFFSSGADLRGGTFTPEPGGRRTEQKPAGRFMLEIISFPKVLAAAVNGPAVGIAVTLLMHCDLVHCSSKATFWAPFTRLALVPELCSSVTFRETMGLSKANELLLLSREINAQTAVDWGIASRVVPDCDGSGDPFHPGSLASLVCREIDDRLLSLPWGPQTAEYFVKMLRGRSRTYLRNVCREELLHLDERFDCGHVQDAASGLRIGSQARPSNTSLSKL